MQTLCLAFLHEYHRTFPEGPRGTFGPVPCVHYDQEVHYRITKPREAAYVGSRRSGGGAWPPGEAWGHFPVQLAFLTVMQESGLFPFPHQGGSPRRGSEHRKRRAGIRAAGSRGVRHTQDRNGERVWGWAGPLCFQGHPHWCTVLGSPKLTPPQLRAWKQAAWMSELSAPESVSSSSVSLGPGLGRGCC